MTTHSATAAPGGRHRTTGSRTAAMTAARRTPPRRRSLRPIGPAVAELVDTLRPTAHERVEIRLSRGPQQRSRAWTPGTRTPRTPPPRRPSSSIAHRGALARARVAGRRRGPARARRGAGPQRSARTARRGMTTTHHRAPPAHSRPGSGSPTDASTENELPVERHRRIHLDLLHADSDGYVEIAAGPRIDGRLRVTTRRDPGHFVPGGASGDPGWLDHLAGLADRHAELGEEVFVAPAVRDGRGASKEHVSHTHWLWIDVDGRGRLPAVRAFAASQAAAARDRVGRVRGRALLLAAARSAARGGDRARARAPDLRARPRVARRPARADRRRRGVQGPLTGHAPRRHRQRQERPARTDRLRGPRARSVARPRCSAISRTRRHRRGLALASARPSTTTIRTSGSRRSTTSRRSPASTCRRIGSCRARIPRTTTRRRVATSASMPAMAGAASRAAPAARSTTSRPCCSAARPAASCAATRFAARATTSPAPST